MLSACRGGGLNHVSHRKREREKVPSPPTRGPWKHVRWRLWTNITSGIRPFTLPARAGFAFLRCAPPWYTGAVQSPCMHAGMICIRYRWLARSNFCLLHHDRPA